LNYFKTIGFGVSFGHYIKFWYFNFYADITQSTFDDAGDIEMKRNEIYGQLPQQQVARNLAYTAGGTQVRTNLH